MTEIDLSSQLTEEALEQIADHMREGGAVIVGPDNDVHGYMVDPSQEINPCFGPGCVKVLLSSSIV